MSSLLRLFSRPPGVVSQACNVVPYGRCKADGSHDHRTNRDNDRTPAQKRGDAKRSKQGK